MKTYVYPADQTGCGYYRLIWVSLALKAMGYDVNVVSPKDTNLQFQASMQGDKMIDVMVPRDAEVIILQRTTHRFLVQAITLMRKKGLTVIVDMDDDLTCIDPRNPAWKLLHPAAGMGQDDHSWRVPSDACQQASFVTVSSLALVKTYATHGRGQVLHNYVPNFFTEVPHDDSTIVGWAGSVHSHPGDLQVMGPAIQRLLKDDIDFRVIGSGQGLSGAIGQWAAERVLTAGVIDFPDWARAITHLGVGCAPIADTKFNAAKSWLKPLEYAAVGAIPISSPRAEYKRLHDDYEIGMLADSPRDWSRVIRRFVADESLRRSESARIRAIVRQKLTIEVNAWRWMEAWMTAREYDREPAVV